MSKALSKSVLHFSLLKFYLFPNSLVNGLGANGQSLSAQAQNIGFELFAGTENFDDDQDFPAMINRQLWQAISRIFDFVDEIQEFISGISVDLDEIIANFVRCDTDLEERIVREIDVELSRARACVGLGGGEPTPTN
jgi:hypothetical protein